MSKDKIKSKTKIQGFEFVGEVTPSDVFGFEFKEVFSPSVSTDGMMERMEERIKKVRKMKKNNIFTGQFHAYKQSQE